VTTHAFYVAAAYGITAVVLLGMIAWLVVDHFGRRRDLAALEASGVRRRSDREGTAA
jgi:heme exporter protein D